jgi:hypothetical protein
MIEYPIKSMQKVLFDQVFSTQQPQLGNEFCDDIDVHHISYSDPVILDLFDLRFDQVQHFVIDHDRYSCPGFRGASPGIIRIDANEWLTGLLPVMDDRTEWVRPFTERHVALKFKSDPQVRSVKMQRATDSPMQIPVDDLGTFLVATRQMHEIDRFRSRRSMLIDSREHHERSWLSQNFHDDPPEDPMTFG